MTDQHAGVDVASDTNASTTSGTVAPVFSPFGAAQALGCDCNDCPLGPCSGCPATPVLPEIRPKAQLYVIGEAPGEEEVRKGAPFVGRSGQLLWAVLRDLGVFRADASVSNALLCRPPREFRAYMKSLGQRNRRRKSAGERMWKSPVECCRPRIVREVAGARAILTLGVTAYASVTGAALDESGMFAARGYPQWL